MKQRNQDSLVALLKKELGRTEKKRPDVIVKIIMVEKFFKGILLLLLSFSAFPIFSDDVVHFLRSLARGSHLFSNARILTSLFVRIEDTPDRRLLAFSIFFLFWGIAELVESFGLMKRRRWAEYLVVFATGIFIPIELYSVLTRFTAKRFALLLFNIFLVYYLIRSRKLFILWNKPGKN